MDPPSAGWLRSGEAAEEGQAVRELLTVQHMLPLYLQGSLVRSTEDAFIIASTAHFSNSSLSAASQEYDSERVQHDSVHW